jgi:hypothetical protein
MEGLRADDATSPLYSTQFPSTDIAPSRQEGLTLVTALDEALALHADYGS